MFDKVRNMTDTMSADLNSLVKYKEAMSRLAQPLQATWPAEDEFYDSTYLARYPSANQLVVCALDRRVQAFKYNNRMYKLDDRFDVDLTPSCMTIELDGFETESRPGGIIDDPYKNLLVLGGTEGQAMLYNMNSHLKIAEIPRLHGDECVRKVQLLSNLGMVSCGMDGRIAVTDPETWRVMRHMGGDFPYGESGNLKRVGHRRGVYSFAHSPYYGCMFSVGFDRKVLIWDPHVDKPTGQLQSHHHHIVDVMVNEDKNQVVTVTADKKINVFDIRTWGCLQSSLSLSQLARRKVYVYGIYTQEETRLSFAQIMAPI